jgi:hypothetical protein
MERNEFLTVFRLLSVYVVLIVGLYSYSRLFWHTCIFHIHNSTVIRNSSNLYRLLKINVSSGVLYSGFTVMIDEFRYILLHEFG